MRGSQSMNVMWMVEPFLALWDQTAASRRTKNARENCGSTVLAVYISYFRNTFILQSLCMNKT